MSAEQRRERDCARGGVCAAAAAMGRGCAALVCAGHSPLRPHPRIQVRSETLFLGPDACVVQLRPTILSFPEEGVQINGDEALCGGHAAHPDAAARAQEDLPYLPLFPQDAAGSHALVLCVVFGLFGN
eukprot:2793758-Rhodomonas_salina.1